MQLDRVTITGADESVSPSDLARLSAEFPFVEWGILFSRKHQGLAPRWPGSEWLTQLRAATVDVPMKLSAHLCGGWVRDLLDGNFTFAAWFDEYLHNYARIQLNFHGERQPGMSTLFLDALRENPSREFIFQIDGVNDHLYDAARQGEPRLDLVPLFDASHGAGVSPGRWPTAAYRDMGRGDAAPRLYHGYAGGLGPENIGTELSIINAYAAPGDVRVWVDMETRVRSDDGRALDLGKVRRVLELARPFVTA